MLYLIRCLLEYIDFHFIVHFDIFCDTDKKDQVKMNEGTNIIQSAEAHRKKFEAWKLRKEELKVT